MIARSRVRKRSGKTAASIRRRNASQKLATVVGNYPVNFIDAGTKAHDIKPRKASILKFTDGGRPSSPRRSTSAPPAPTHSSGPQPRKACAAHSSWAT